MSGDQPRATEQADRRDAPVATPAVTTVSVLVVSYNTRELTLACVRSVLATGRDQAIEVIVVDNASADGSAAALAAEFPTVRLIALDQNIGFARANNLAAESAEGEFLLLLNPDTVMLDGCIGHLVDFMRRHPEAGACGGRTYLGDGTLDPGSCWRRITPWSALSRAVGLSSLFPGTRWFDPEAMGDWPRDSERVVDVVTGCLLIVERALWNEVGGFDPRFFMYCEDQDLCLRLAARGRACWICPAAEIVHYCGASEKLVEDKVVRMNRAKSLLFEKHWGPIAARLGTSTLSLDALLRSSASLLCGLLSKRWRQRHRTWRSIFRRRREWHHRADSPAWSAAQPVDPGRASGVGS